MRYKAVNTRFFVFNSVPGRYKTVREKNCQRSIMLKCDEVVDNCLSVLTFVPDLFVTNKMLEKLDDAFFNY